jgi:hypothetical protein
MSIKLNAEELEALAGKRHFLRCLYIFGIRAYMDYSTGLTGGPKRRISWQSLAEEMYVEPEPGVSAEDTGKPSESKLRRAAEALEKAGLIRRISRGKFLIFECLLAERDKSVQKQADIKPTGQADTKAAGSEASPDIALEQAGSPEADTKKRGFFDQADTHPVSGNTTKLYLPDDEMQRRIGRWKEFLSSYGFPFHRIQTATVIPMLINWVKEGITETQARLAIECANAKKGGLPISPAYYASFVKEVLNAEKAAKEQTKKQGRESYVTRSTRTRKGDKYAQIISSCREQYESWD